MTFWPRWRQWSSSEPRQRGLIVRVDADSLPAQLCGDPERLTQALLHYASNAVKFTERGTITLKASASTEESTGFMLRFEVVDTGIGIAPADLGHVFESFRQADGSSTRRHGGTGLGLAITRELVHLMGGEVGVSSVPGQGSSFWLTARLARAAEPDAEAGQNAEVSAEMLAEHFSGWRVLLAEDRAGEPRTGAVAIALCRLECGRRAGWPGGRSGSARERLCAGVDGCPDAAHGWHSGYPPDCAPCRTGLALPIIAVTANDFEGDRQRCFDAGMNDFVAKPVVPQACCIRSLARWLSRGKANRPGGRLRRTACSE